MSNPRRDRENAERLARIAAIKARRVGYKVTPPANVRLEEKATMLLADLAEAFFHDAPYILSPLEVNMLVGFLGMHGYSFEHFTASPPSDGE